MSSDSPASILFNSDGYEVAILDGSSIDLSPAILVAGSDGENAKIIKTDNNGVIRIDPIGNTVQPISGTITANIGISNGLALNLTLTDGSQKTKITDGTNNVAVLNSNPTGTEQALIVRNIPSGIQSISGTITANAGSGTFAISATSLPLPSNASTEFTLSTRLSDTTFTNRINTLGQKTMVASTPVVLSSDHSVISVAGSGNFNIVQSVAANLNATVTGTITANIGTTNGLMLDSTFTGRINTLGQKTMANSTPVVFASDQSSFSISGSVTANIGTTNGLALDTTLQTIDTDLKATQPRDITDRSARLLGHVNVDNTVAVSQTSSPWGIKSEVQLDYDTGAGTQNLSVIGLGLPGAGGVVSGGTSSNPIRIDPVGTTVQPISGTITANQGGAPWSMSGSGNFTVVQATAANLNATVIGTVTSNIGTTNGLALDNTLTGGTQRTKITDGTNNAAISNSNPAGTEQALIVRNIPSGTQTISGTVTANIGTTNGLFLDSTFTGRINTLGQKTMANSTPIVIASDQSSIPISGTITSNIGTTNGLALDATLSKLTITQNVALGSNTQILIGGSVTTAAPTYVTGNISPISITTAGGIRVDGSGTTQPISGTITANAGSGTFTVSGTVTSNIGTTNGLMLDTTFTGRINTQGQKTMAASTPVVISSDQSSIPVSGTITSNIGITNGLALDATLTGGTQKSIVRSGAKGSTAAADITSVSIDANTQALHVQLSGQGISATPLRIDPTGTTIQPVSGIITANAGSGTFTISGAVTVSSGTITSNIGTTNGLALDTTLAKLTILQSTSLGSNTQILIGGSVTTSSPTYVTGNINPLSLTTTGALRIDGSGVTQPISGTITSNIGTTNGLMLDASFTGRINTLGQKTMAASTPIVIASDQSSVPISGTITANIGTTNGLTLDTTLTKLTILQSTSLGSNTQILIGGSVTTASPTYVTGNINPISLTVAGAVRIDGSGTTQPISGTITSNIGTTNGLMLDATFTGRINTLGQKTMANSTPIVIASDQSTISVSGSGNFTIVQATAANLNATVIGTVTSNIGTTNGLMLDTTFTGRINTQGQKTMAASTPIVIASDQSSIPISGTITANIGTTNGLALDSTLTKLTITQSTSLGSNTQILIGGSVTTAAPTYTTGNINPLSLTTTGALRVDGSGVTQPISGTITSNIGTTNGLMLDATFTGRINTQGQKTMATSTPVVLASDQSTISVSGSGNFTVVQATAANLNATVIGTITANIGTTNGLALDATLTGGTQRTKITDGTNNAALSNAAPAGTEQALIVRNIPSGIQSISNAAVVSAGNSSTATLTGAATFTGTSDSSIGYQSIVVNVMAIGGSAPPGTLRVEQSSDGANWDIRDDFAVDGGTASPTGSFDIDIGLVASNFRISYINGATAQTAFRLQTLKFPIKTSLPNSATRKGIQSQTFLPVQDAKDTGRVVKIFTATAVAGVTAEALVTLTPLTDFAIGSTGTSFTVTAGKRLRIQSLQFTVRATAATAVGGLIRLRISASGAVTTGTNVIAALGSYESVAVIGNAFTNWITLPDGLELTGTMQLGITQLVSATTAQIDCSLICYEY